VLQRFSCPPKKSQIPWEAGQKSLAGDEIWAELGSRAARPRPEFANQAATSFGLCEQQRRGSGAVEPCRATRGQQLQDVAILLPTSGHNAEHPLDESATCFAIGSATALAP
jgi:hypothetical protein